MRDTLATLTSLKILFPVILILCGVAIFLRRTQQQGSNNTANQQTETANEANASVLARFLFALYLLIYIYLTFAFRRPYPQVKLLLEPLRSYREAFTLTPLKIRRLGVAREILLNILLTIPAGLLLPILFHRTKHPYRWTAAAIILLTVATETIQYFTHLGFCETDDVINNILGGLLGMGILAAGSRIGNKRAKKNE